MSFKSTKIIELGSCAFRQPQASSHCRFLHGYRLTAKFWFKAKELDSNNWVVDFGGLKQLKAILQTQFDHTLCISDDDPEIDRFSELDKAGVCDLRVMDGGVGVEKFAEFCYQSADSYVNQLTNGRCRCVKAEVFEHENNSAIYEVNLDDHETLMNTGCNEDITTEEVAEDIATAVEVKQQDSVTRPPFAKKKGAPLTARKTKGRWADERGTFGI